MFPLLDSILHLEYERKSTYGAAAIQMTFEFKSKLIEGVAARAEEFDNDYVFATIVAVKK